jgi:Membrane domain of glycerophosphoryl diester phosphodiesterase
MTDNPPWGASAPGEPDPEQGPPTPWFPPAGQPGGEGQPSPGAGAGQPASGSGYAPPPPGSGYGQPGGYGQPAGRAQGYWSPPTQAPKPGVIPLRPLGVGEILDGAFTSIRRNPRATLGIAAILLTFSAVVTTAVSLIVAHTAGPLVLPSAGQQLTQAQVTRLLTRVLEVFVPLAAVTVVLYFVVDIVLTGMLTVVIGRSVLGHTITAGDAWRIARPRLPALLGVTLLIPCIILGVWLLLGAILLGLALGHATGGLVALVAVPGIIAAFCLTIWFSVKFRMAGPAVVLEREGPARSLARSWRLVKGSFWRVFGITLLAGLIVAVTSAILQIPFSVLSALVGGSSPFFGGGTYAGGTALGVIIGAIGGIIAGAVTRPIAAGVTVLLYVDMRMRREGLDLVLQTAAADGTAASGDEYAAVWRPGAGAMPGGPATAAESPPPAGSGAPPAW